MAKSNGAEASHTQSEVRRKRGRDNVATEVVNLRWEVAVSSLVSSCQTVRQPLFKCTERAALAFHLHRNMNTASNLGPHTQTDRGTCPGVGL